MVLSPAEKSYIYDGLVASAVSRSDSRLATQYRPLKASCSILPASSGSSRIYTVDGIECITSIKTQVVREQQMEKLLGVKLEIQGDRDDSILTTNSVTALTNSLLTTFDKRYLKITEKYYFKLNIDVAVLATPEDFQSSSYTLQCLLELISMGVYLALKSTKVPLLTSEENDGDIEEEPTFNDDWEEAKLLLPNDINPIMLFVVGVANTNVIIDPSVEEQQVLQHGLCIGYSNGQVVAPVQSLLFDTTSTDAVSPKTIVKSMELISHIGKDVTAALNVIAQQEVDAFELAF